MEVLFPGSSTARRRFDVHVREHASHRGARVDGLSVTPFEVRHAAGAPAYGVRVGDGDRTLAYTGDTEWTDALLELADGADLLLAEGYSPAPVRWHLDLGSLAAHRDRLGCARLVLTHLSPTALGRRSDRVGRGAGRSRAGPLSGCAGPFRRAQAPGELGHDQVVGGVDQLAQLVVVDGGADSGVQLDAVPAVLADVGAAGDRVGEALAQLGGLVGVATALDAEAAAAEEGEDLAADLGDQVALPRLVLDPRRAWPGSRRPGPHGAPGTSTGCGRRAT
jgi:hypothetical protein